MEEYGSLADEGGEAGTELDNSVPGKKEDLVEYLAELTAAARRPEMILEG
jgi:hypothetical protein